MLPSITLGNISKNTKITDFALRVIDESDPLRLDIHLQGHIQNICDLTLDEVKCDISYYDGKGRFLGLNATSFTDLDDVDPGESAPFDLHLNIPAEAVTGKINTHSKRVLQDIGVALKAHTDAKKENA